jgi:3-oxoacyl-[acyl-carrier protein] reductase
MSGRLAGQVALVTGGSRGIGRAIACRLAQAGASVVITYAQQAAQAEETLERIRREGGTASAEQFDVGDPEATRAAMDRIVDREKRLDILVNNAGVAVDGLVVRLREEDWERALRVNLTGVFHCTRAALRTMMRARYGRIVNLTSVVAAMGNTGQAAYAAAKAGVIGFTRSMAREVSSRGITVNAVAPGFIETDMTGGLDEAQRGFYASVIPAGRMGRPEEIASAIEYLASPDAAYVTGHVLHVNGGLYM